MAGKIRHVDHRESDNWINALKEARVVKDTSKSPTRREDMIVQV